MSKGIMEAEQKTLAGKIDVIKMAYPNIFKTENTLATALKTVTTIFSIEGTPYSLEGRTAVIFPFNYFSLKFNETETVGRDKSKKWNISIYFSDKNNEGNSTQNKKNGLRIVYMGNRNSKGKPQPADKLLIHFLSSNTRILFDLQNLKIGFDNIPKKKASYSIDDYTTVLSFDQSTELQNLLLENPKLKMIFFGFEINKENNITGFRYRGGLFGNNEQNITLPLSINVILGKFFEKQGKNLPAIKAPRVGYIQKSLTETLKIGKIKIDIITNGNSQVISTGNFKFTLPELKYLYIVSSEMSKRKELLIRLGMKIKNFFIYKTRIINRNSLLFGEDETPNFEPLSELIKMAEKLGILNEEFIKGLEKALTI